MNEMLLEINGVLYTGFVSAEASTSMEQISGIFTFNVSVLNDLQKFPIKNGSKCRVIINNQPFITGFVEKININYDDNDHSISVSGRDRTCDFVDSTLGEGLHFTGGISLIDITKKVLDKLGINDIKVYSNFQMANFDKSEILDISSQTGESAFEFIDKYASKRQCLVMSDGDGNIVFARTSDTKINTVLTSSPNSQSTIFSASVDYDDTKRFYKYILSSQQNTTTNVVTDLNNIDNKKSVSVVASAIDDGARKTRTYNMMQSAAAYNSTKNLQNRAVWEANFRRSRHFKYKATVQGFSPINDPNIIWKPNLLVSVDDAYCDIPSGKPLLINSVKFNYSIDNGSTTTLELVDKESYTVEVLQGVKFTKRKGANAGSKVSSVVSDLSPYQGRK